MNLSHWSRGFPLRLFFFFVLAPVWGVSFASGFPAPVEVAAVAERVLAPSVWVAGSVVSRDDARIAAETEGRLIFIAEEGASISAGDVLAEVDHKLLDIALMEAEAEVSRERAQLKFFEREVERLQRLARQNNAAHTQLDETQAQRDGTTYGLSAAQARLQLAQERVERSRIRAPFDGLVVARLKREGEWANRGEALVQLVNSRALEVDSAVPPRLERFLKTAQVVMVEVNGDQFPATVRTVVDVAEGPSRLMRIKLDVSGDGWQAGQLVRVAIPSAQPRKVLTIPRDAMVLRGGGVSVFRVKDDNTAEKVSVTTGVAQGDYIEVQGALNVGDKVVIRGGERLRPGQALRFSSGNTSAGQWNSAESGSAGKNPWWPGNKGEAEESDSDDSAAQGSAWWPGGQSESDGEGAPETSAWSDQQAAVSPKDEE